MRQPSIRLNFRMANRMNQRVRALTRLFRQAGPGAIAVTLLTVVSFRGHLDFASVIPLYLLIVVLQSLTGNYLSSAIISVLCATCLDFFFTEPLFSLYIRNPLNALALIAFLFTALVITRLVCRVREEAASSRDQKERLDRLYHLSQEVLGLDPEAIDGPRVLEPFQRFFGVTAICIFDTETAELQVIGQPRCALAEETRQAYIGGKDFDDFGLQVSVRHIRGWKWKGAVAFEGLAEPDRTASALAAITASLIERARTFRRASAAAAATQTEQYRSAVLDALAHEFKTPLATILAAAGGIQEAGSLAPALVELADTVENEAARLSSLTSRLLRTARLEREEIKPRM